MSKQLTLGILAHVDAGKTTLSEAMLYTAGTIRKLGRVDNGDSFFDNYEVEKNRGITVFSKQARLNWNDSQITILDTPGHDDFSAEMERALDVIDYALLSSEWCRRTSKSYRDSLEASQNTKKFLRLYSSIRWILLSLIGTNRSAASRADLVKDSSILV